MPIIEAIKVILGLSVALFNFYLGTLVLSRNKRSVIRMVFFLIAWSFGIWATSLVLYEHPIILTSSFWVHANYVMVTVFIVMHFLFSLVFPNPARRVKWPIVITAAIAYLLFSCWLLLGTKYWIIDVVVDRQRGLQTIMGAGYLWWTIAGYCLVFWALLNFMAKNKTATPLQKVQMRYYWVGFFMFALVVTVPDVIIPLVWHDTRYFIWSILGNLCYCGTVAYLILRHRFLDIRAIAVRSLAYFIATVLMGICYVVGIYWLLSLFAPGQLSTSRFILSTLLTLIIALSFQPVLHFFQKTTINIFYQDYYTIDQFLSDVSQVMATKLELNAVMCGVLDVVHKYLHSTCSTIIVHDREYDYVVESSCATSLHMSMVSEDLAALKKGSKLLVYEEMDESAQKDVMRKHDIGLFMPLATKQATVGYLLLGPKSSGDVYFSQDIKALQIMAPELAVALENAQSYEKIKIFNETLKVEIAKATSDLRQANVHLRGLDRMKDEFISIASHELRTPLTTLKGFLELELKEPDKLAYDSRNHLERAYASSKRMISLVNDMLDVSRIESGKLTLSLGQCDLVAAAREVVAEEETRIKEKHLTIEVTGSPNVVVMADASRIHQILLNLIDNAVKFTGYSGSVTVACKDFDTKGEVAISDTGGGIRKEDFPRLFTKFGKLGMSFSSMSETQGTGLGLYICKKLVELQKGTISVASEVGHGSTFTVTLPKEALPGGKKSDTLKKEGPHGT